MVASLKLREILSYLLVALDLSGAGCDFHVFHLCIIRFTRCLSGRLMRWEMARLILMSMKRVAMSMQIIVDYMQLFHSLICPQFQWLSSSQTVVWLLQNRPIMSTMFKTASSLFQYAFQMLNLIISRRCLNWVDLNYSLAVFSYCSRASLIYWRFPFRVLKMFRFQSMPSQSCLIEFTSLLMQLSSLVMVQSPWREMSPPLQHILSQSLMNTYSLYLYSGYRQIALTSCRIGPFNLFSSFVSSISSSISREYMSCSLFLKVYMFSLFNFMQSPSRQQNCLMQSCISSESSLKGLLTSLFSKMITPFSFLMLNLNFDGMSISFLRTRTDSVSDLLFWFSLWKKKLKMRFWFLWQGWVWWPQNSLKILIQITEQLSSSLKSLRMQPNCSGLMYFSTQPKSLSNISERMSMMQNLLDWRILELRYQVASFLPLWKLLIILKRSWQTYQDCWDELMSFSMRKRISLNSCRIYCRRLRLVSRYLSRQGIHWAAGAPQRLRIQFISNLFALLSQNPQVDASSAILGGQKLFSNSRWKGGSLFSRELKGSRGFNFKGFFLFYLLKGKYFPVSMCLRQKFQRSMISTMNIAEQMYSFSP